MFSTVAGYITTRWWFLSRPVLIVALPTHFCVQSAFCSEMGTPRCATPHFHLAILFDTTFFVTHSFVHILIRQPGGA
jgi:hypothetical protein